MIIEEFKSGSTLIRIDDRNIEKSQNDKDLTDILMGLIVKKITE